MECREKPQIVEISRFRKVFDISLEFRGKPRIFELCRFIPPSQLKTTGIVWLVYVTCKNVQHIQCTCAS